jgi:hypothetical protein
MLLRASTAATRSVHASTATTARVDTRIVESACTGGKEQAQAHCELADKHATTRTECHHHPPTVVSAVFLVVVSSLPPSPPPRRVLVASAAAGPASAPPLRASSREEEVGQATAPPPTQHQRTHACTTHRWVDWQEGNLEVCLQDRQQLQARRANGVLTRG